MAGGDVGTSNMTIQLTAADLVATERLQDLGH